jgi:hypothetical protein
MVPNARVEDLKKDTDFGWVTALRNTDIQKLAEGEGPLQMSLFDEQNLAEISPPNTPANVSSPAATPPWPPNAPTSAPPCLRPPRKSSRPSRKPWTPAASTAPEGSA